MPAKKRNNTKSVESKAGKSEQNTRKPILSLTQPEEQKKILPLAAQEQPELADPVDFALFNKASAAIKDCLLRIGQFPSSFIVAFESGDAEAEDVEERTTTLTVTNGFDKMFRLKLSYSFMKAHRYALGIEGTWQAYFDLLVQAISEGDNAVKIIAVEKPQMSNESGSNIAQHTQSSFTQMTMVSSQNSTSSGEKEMILEIYYPLMQGARIRGSIKMGPHEVKGLQRHRIIQEIFMKMAGKLSMAK